MPIYNRYYSFNKSGLPCAQQCIFCLYPQLLQQWGGCPYAITCVEVGVVASSPFSKYKCVCGVQDNLQCNLVLEMDHFTSRLLSCVYLQLINQNYGTWISLNCITSKEVYVSELPSHPVCANATVLHISVDHNWLRKGYARKFITWNWEFWQKILPYY